MAISIGIVIVFARRRDHCCWRTAASRAVTQLTTKAEPRASNCNLFNPMAHALVTRQHSNGPAIRRASIRFLMHETNVMVAHVYGSKRRVRPVLGRAGRRGWATRWCSASGSLRAEDGIRRAFLGGRRNRQRLFGPAIDREEHVDEVGAVRAAVDHHLGKADSLAYWHRDRLANGLHGRAAGVALNLRDGDVHARATGVRKADLQVEAKVVLAGAGLLAAPAVPFTTVRREMPGLGFVISDLLVTCTPHGGARSRTQLDVPTTQSVAPTGPPGLPAPYRYHAVLWPHFGNGVAI